MKITIKKKYILPGIIGAVVLGVLVVNGGFFGKGAFESWTTNEECFEFNVDTQTITAYNFEYKKCGTKINILSKIGGVEVRRIGKNAFAFVFLNQKLQRKMEKILNKGGKDIQQTIEDVKGSFKTIKAVTIPNTVTDIGEYAFSYNNLTSVTLPNSVVEIGRFTFRNNNLTSITLSNSVTNIGEYAFSDNKLTSLTIPDSVSKSTKLLFNGGIIYKENEDNTLTLAYNANLNNTKITIPSKVNGIRVTKIGSSAFMFNDLTSINIPNYVTEIGSSAFRDNNLTSVTIPDSVTEIGRSAFMFNNLTSVTIPNSVIEVGERAFRDNNLTSVMISKNTNVSLGGSSSSFDGDVKITRLTLVFLFF